MKIQPAMLLPEVSDVSGGFSLMRILQLLISSVGIIANFTVVFAFLNHKQLRCKIPNRFIINQVSHTYNFSHSFMLNSDCAIAVYVGCICDPVISVRILRLLHNNSVDYS